ISSIARSASVASQRAAVSGAWRAGSKSGLLLWRDVSRGDIGTGAEEVALGLLHEVFARARVGEIQPVLVHEHGLVLEPLRPGFLRDVLPDALAELAGIRGKLEALGLAAEFDALHHPSHRTIICA